MKIYIKVLYSCYPTEKKQIARTFNFSSEFGHFLNCLKDVTALPLQGKKIVKLEKSIDLWVFSSVLLKNIMDLVKIKPPTPGWGCIFKLVRFGGC